MHNLRRRTMQVRRNGRMLARRAITGGLIALLAAPALLVANEAVGPVPIAHAAGTYNKLPGDDIQFIYLPDDCGSRNIEGAGTRIRTNVGTGSTVFVGQTITVKLSIIKGILTGGFQGNDGPDPLNLDLVPNGYLKQAAPTVGSPVDFDHNVTWGGSGSTGPVAPHGTWGYTFDANSSPKLIGPDGNDGTNEMITISFTATKAGDITIPKLQVSGYDATPKGGDVGCHLDLSLVWHIIDLEPPVTTIDQVKVDARYPHILDDDKTTGSHNVSIDVLKNDRDPNLPNGPDDHNVKLVSWSANLDCGDGALNGVTATNANFDSLSEGPCTYTPAVGAIDDDASYTMVQRSGLLTKHVDVVINLVPNDVPLTSDADLDVQSPLGNVQGSVLDYASDPEGDPLVCIPTSANASAGTFTVDAACAFSYTAPIPAGLQTAEVEVCDNHETLSTGQLGGNNVVRRIGYELDPSPNHDDDLDIEHTQRCSIAHFNFNATALGLLAAMHPKDDIDKVDAGYPAEDYTTGPYNLAIKVLDNDDLLGGTVYDLDLTGLPVPAQGTAAIAASGDPQSPFVTFTPTNGWTGPVKMRYRVCVHYDPDPNDPNNPLQDICASANIYVNVVRNRRPEPKDDDFGLLYREQYNRFPQLNDKEPDIDPIQCSTNLPAVNPPQAFAELVMHENCTLTFTSSPAYTGPAAVTYRMCDIHFLQVPAWPAPTGYGPFAIPGGQSHRCASATITMSFADPPPAVDVPQPGPGNNPLCVADAFVTTQGMAITNDVLANDSDLDENNQPSPVTLIDPGAPVSQQGGAVAKDGTQLKYTPAANFVGVDIATYDAIDTDGHGCNAEVTYTVKADVDGDGVPNDIDPDIDGDGIPNDQDPDMDGDGIPNGQDSDVDGDGIPNDQDVDSNSDGLPDPEATVPTVMPGGTLPATGISRSSTTGLAPTALVLVAGGFVLVAATRRRRGGQALRR